MQIEGIQKLTLLDYPGYLAATLFTPGCPLRCPYCHNSSLALQDSRAGSIEEGKVLEFLNQRKGILEGVCISGGEPLMQKDLSLFLTKIKDLDYRVKLDTSGFYPKRLANILKSNLVDYVAMDLKNTPEKYPLTTGRQEVNFDNFEEALKALEGSGVEYELRTTIVREHHALLDLLEMGALIPEGVTWYWQLFEDSGGTFEKGLTSYSREELEVFRERLLASSFRGDICIR